MKKIAAGLLTLLVAACAPQQPYVRPAFELPAKWSPEAPWREGTPNDDQVRGPWWKRFGDPTLDSLQARAITNNPSLGIASARLAQARASAQVASASLLPQVNLGTRVARNRIAANRPLTNYNSPNFTTEQNDFVPSLSVAYEADFFGRVQSTVDAATASAQQSAIDLENARLLLSADLASNYFSVRQLDIELDVLAKSIAVQRRALDLATARHDLGVTSGLDVAQQKALLDNTLTQVDVLKRQRDQFEHALATLVGTPAPAFTLAEEISPRVPPVIPVGVPSNLLERRPDVASAERAMAAANAQMGVARAAYYPSITLAPSIGVESRRLVNLFDMPSLIWSVGGNLLLPLFDAGRVDANMAFAKAGYEATVGNYRRVVLTAMQEVSDGISGGQALDRALAQAEEARKSAESVLDLATARYEGGAAAYLEVITAQQGLLASQRQVAQLLGQRMLVSVFLIKALGGDWDGKRRP